MYNYMLLYIHDEKAAKFLPHFFHSSKMCKCAATHLLLSPYYVLICLMLRANVVQTATDWFTCVPVPQIRSRDFWHCINLYVCMYD